MKRREDTGENMFPDAPELELWDSSVSWRGERGPSYSAMPNLGTLSGPGDPCLKRAESLPQMEPTGLLLKRMAP